ncbi:MAG: hypothetical protein RL479_1468 [Verrucomicrobiota bacterium]
MRATCGFLRSTFPGIGPVGFALLALVAEPVGATPWGNERFVLTPDLSARLVRDHTGGRQGMQYDLAFDAYAKLGTPQRDVATVVAQVYLSRVQRHPAPPPFFDGPSDTEVLPMITTINLHLTEDRRLNLKVGHLELPYGLEATISNAGELRGFTLGSNTALMVDWGATLNGTLERFQYDVGVGRGSGMFYADNFDPYALFGRIGSPVDTETYGGVTGWGFSVFRGKVLNPARTAVHLRQRVAVDGQVYVGPLGLLGELSTGSNGEGAGRARVLNGLAEANLTSRRETLSGYVQLVGERTSAGGRGVRTWTQVVGVRWTPAPGWILSAARDERIWRQPGTPPQVFLNLQVRRRL